VLAMFDRPSDFEALGKGVKGLNGLVELNVGQPNAFQGRLFQGVLMGT